MPSREEAERRRKAALDARRPGSTQRGYGGDWRDLRERQPKTPCVDCGAGWHKSHHLDHIVPRARGGSDAPANLAWRCWRCHSIKTATQDSGFARR